MAARGARAAAGEAADHRVLGRQHGFDSRANGSAAFVQRLRELGWIEGRTVAIEYRWAEGRNERSRRDRGRVRPAQGRCHCHVGNPTSRSRQSRRRRSSRSCSRRWETRSAPAWSPVLARPGGNVTGLSMQQPILAGKRLELLREVVPGLRRLAIMANATIPPPYWRCARFRQRPARSASKSSHRNPASGGYRARLRRAQGPRGSTLCL